MRTFNIGGIDSNMRAAIQEKIDNLNKPKGSLGELENLAMRICLMQHTLSPVLTHPCHLLFGGDHGIEREGVSASPREVTWQQMINFTRGGGGVNMFCRQHGFKLRIIDVGIDYDLADNPDIIGRKIAPGTRNFLHEAAMSEEEFDRAIEVGCEQVDDCFAEGCNIISIGEMGIANTSASSIWMSLMTGKPLADCIGRGSGVNDKQLEHKRNILTTAMERFLTTEDAHDIPGLLRYFGGFEMVAAVGAMLRAAEHHMVVLVDGFIMTACALGAYRLYPDVYHYLVFAHCGDESGHKSLLQFFHCAPLLRLGLRLGEGTGALCAYPIVESSVRMMNEMNNFENAKITKYF